MIKRLGTKSWLIAVMVIAVLCYGAYAATVRLQERSSSVYMRQGYQTLREDAILTTSYVATDNIRLTVYNQVGIFFSIDKGSLTSFQYRIQWSPDNSTWYDEVTESIVAGVITDTVCYYTITLSGNVDFYKLFPYRSNYLRVQVRGTGTVTNSSCAVYLEAFTN